MAMTSDDELIVRVRNSLKRADNLGILGAGLAEFEASEQALDTLARRLEETEAVIADFVHLCVSALTDGLFDDDQAQLEEMHRIVDSARSLLHPEPQEVED